LSAFIQQYLHLVDGKYEEVINNGSMDQTFKAPRQN